MAEMQAASQAGKLLDVYTVRHKLLQTYPELVEDPKLVAEMVAAAERERSAVKFVAEEVRATDERSHEPDLGVGRA